MLIALGALASVATSAVEPGERTNDDPCILDCEDEGPVCPAGEECSDDTPAGLYFGGMQTGDIPVLGTEWPHATAVGGEQRIRIFLDGAGEQPLNLPFDADFTTDALSIASQSGASVLLRGETRGSGRLRILEQGTDLLYDRIQLEAAEATELQLVPAGRISFTDLLMLDEAAGYAVVAGGRARMTAATYATDGTRVVDDNIDFDDTPAVRSDPQGFADTVELAPSSPGLVTVTVRAGTFEGSADVRAVTSPDAIEPLFANPVRVPIGYSRPYCFAARAGGDYVLGASWSYGATPGLRIEMDPNADYVSDCVILTGEQVGAATLTVVAGDRVASVVFDVVGDTSTARAPAPDPVEPQLAGDRAEQLLRPAFAQH